jgi:hypothetical protein
MGYRIASKRGAVCVLVDRECRLGIYATLRRIDGDSFCGGSSQGTAEIAPGSFTGILGDPQNHRRAGDSSQLSR